MASERAGGRAGRQTLLGLAEQQQLITHHHRHYRGRRRRRRHYHRQPRCLPSRKRRRRLRSPLQRLPILFPPLVLVVSLGSSSARTPSILGPSGFPLFCVPSTLCRRLPTVASPPHRAGERTRQPRRKQSGGLAGWFGKPAKRQLCIAAATAAASAAAVVLGHKKAFTPFEGPPLSFASHFSHCFL